MKHLKKKRHMSGEDGNGETGWFGGDTGNDGYFSRALVAPLESVHGVLQNIIHVLGLWKQTRLLKNSERKKAPGEASIMMNMQVVRSAPSSVPCAARSFSANGAINCNVRRLCAADIDQLTLKAAKINDPNRQVKSREHLHNENNGDMSEID